jgi:hypothetical protein
VQRLARAEGAATRVLEYSFFSQAGVEEDMLAIWVVSGATGELLCSKVVASTGLGGSRGRSIQGVLAEARSSMNVRGRDAMSDSAPDKVLDESHSTEDGVASGERVGPRRDLSQVEVAKRELLMLVSNLFARIAPR